MEDLQEIQTTVLPYIVSFSEKMACCVGGGAIILTFSPPYGFEGVAPGCAGGGGSTEL